MKVIFAGTPDFAAAALKAIAAAGFEIPLVLTQPDRPKGRGMQLAPSPVKQAALELGLRVAQPEKLRNNAEALQMLKEVEADVMVVAAYGLILPQDVLDTPKHGCLNIHASLLPRWRGAAPIQRAIWAGDAQTGITIMQMDEGLDTGDMLHKVYCDILPTETSGDLYHKLAQLAPPALIDVLDHLENGKFSAEKQDDGQSNYADKLSKEEAKLDWALPAAQLERNIRAFNPWPMAYFSATDQEGHPQTLKVYQAEVLPHQEKPAGTILRADKNGIQVATADGVLNLLQLQPAGKKPMSAQDLLNGRAAWFPLNKILG